MAEQMDSDFSALTGHAESTYRLANRIGSALAIELEFGGVHAAAGHFLVDDDEGHGGSVDAKEVIGQVDYGVDKGQSFLTQQWR